MTADYVYLALAWGAWCAVHSVLISHTVTGFIQSRIGGAYRFYRLSYNVFSVLSFILVYYYQQTFPAQTISVPLLPWLAIQIAGLAAGAGFIVAGSRIYDNKYFLGFRQIADIQSSLDRPVPLKRDGILGVVRHPYYTGGILLLLAYPSFAVPSLIMRGILLVYLVIGTFLEERKLLIELGDSYRKYMTEVPRFFPRLIRRK